MFVLRNAGGAGQQLRDAGTAYTERSPGWDSTMVTGLGPDEQSGLVIPMHRFRGERGKAHRDVRRSALLGRGIPDPLAGPHEHRLPAPDVDRAALVLHVEAPV